MHIEKTQLRRYFAKAMFYNNMDQTKLPKQLLNLSEEIYRLLHHIRFLEVCCAYNIFPDGFFVNKNRCQTKK